MSVNIDNIQPKTPEAPVVAPSPGFTAPAPVIHPEDPAEFEAFHRLIRQERQPLTAIGQSLVFQYAATLWRLRRIPGLDSRCVASFFRNPASAHQLSQLSLYESRLLRHCDHIERQLKNLAALRQPVRLVETPQPGLTGLGFQAAFQAAVHAASQLPGQGPLPGLHDAPRVGFIQPSPPTPSSQ